MPKRATEQICGIALPHCATASNRRPPIPRRRNAGVRRCAGCAARAAPGRHRAGVHRQRLRQQVATRATPPSSTFAAIGHRTALRDASSTPATSPPRRANAGASSGLSSSWRRSEDASGNAFTSRPDTRRSKGRRRQRHRRFDLVDRFGILLVDPRVDIEHKCAVEHASSGSSSGPAQRLCQLPAHAIAASADPSVDLKRSSNPALPSAMHGRCAKHQPVGFSSNCATSPLTGIAAASSTMTSQDRRASPPGNRRGGGNTAAGADRQSVVPRRRHTRHAPSRGETGRRRGTVRCGATTVIRGNRPPAVRRWPPPQDRRLPTAPDLR